MRLKEIEDYPERRTKMRQWKFFLFVFVHWRMKIFRVFMRSNWEEEEEEEYW
jgi:hypothetical protein